MSFPDRQTLVAAWRGWYSNDLEPAGPVWLQWVLTGVFCMVVALCFTLLGMAFSAFEGRRGWASPAAWGPWYGRNLIVSLVIGYLVHAMFTVAIPAVGKARIRRFSHGQRALFFSAIPLLGVAVGWPLGVWLVVPDGGGWLARAGGGTIAGMLMFGAVISFVFFVIFSAKAKQAYAERHALESQLRLLQAQMEPHFLFNTLAGVQTLIDVEPQRAKRMLESFTDYLRATIASLRTSDSTVAQELALAEAYLGLMQQRMEDRLAFEVDAAPDALPLSLPPLLLQPLVENAIHHGLEPKVEGGRVRVAVRRDGAALVIDVVDDGLGLDAPRRRSSGNGVALANLRQRLLGRWGQDATLTLIPAEGGGTHATLRLPAEPPGPAAPAPADTPR